MNNKRGAYDVAIIGGGPAGLSLAAALGAAGATLCLIDRDPPEKYLHAKADGRTTAIASAAQNVLEDAGVWAHVRAACPIEDIRVADNHGPNTLTFRARDVADASRGRPFGWIIENHDFRAALLQRLRGMPHVTMLAPADVLGMEAGAHAAVLQLAGGKTIAARLAVAADGRASPSRRRAGIAAREWEYWQAAVVCTLAHERPHGNVAVEHFMPGGPLAILPMTDLPAKQAVHASAGKALRHRSSIVWTERRETAKVLMDMPAAGFLAHLGAHTSGMLGAIALAGPRFCYPLGLMHAKRYTAPRMALAGEAAHAIHPIAGQGFNLSMRDIASLAALVGEAIVLGLDPGSPELLRRYERARRADNTAMTVTTDALDRLFSNSLPGLGLLRAAGLGAVERMPRAKHFFMRQAMGLHTKKPAKKRA